MTNCKPTFAPTPEDHIYNRILYILYNRIRILFKHKNKLILIFATTWMDLEGIVLTR